MNAGLGTRVLKHLLLATSAADGVERGEFACERPARRALWASRWPAAEYRGTSEAGLADAATRRGGPIGNGRVKSGRTIGVSIDAETALGDSEIITQVRSTGPESPRAAATLSARVGRLGRPGECRLERLVDGVMTAGGRAA